MSKKADGEADKSTYVPRHQCSKHLIDLEPSQVLDGWVRGTCSKCGEKRTVRAFEAANSQSAKRLASGLASGIDSPPPSPVSSYVDIPIDRDPETGQEVFMSRDPWAGDETGGVQNAVVEFTSAKFGYTDYNKGKTPLLIIEGVATPDDGGAPSETHLWYSIGDAFEPSPDGNSCRHAKDPTAFLNRRSAVMDFITACFKAGAEQELRKRVSDPKDNASAWVGLKFHFGELVKTGSFTPEGETEKRDIYRSLPDKFLGVVGQAGDTPQAPTTTSTPNPAGTEVPQTATEPVNTAPAPAPATNGSSPDPRKLTVIAKSVKANGGDYWAFLDKAIEGGFDPNDPQCAEDGAVWATANA